MGGGGGGDESSEIDDDSLFVHNWLRSTSSALSPITPTRRKIGVKTECVSEQVQMRA